jgi:hypothetical protein
MLPPQTRFRGESSRESEGRADARPCPSQASVGACRGRLLSRRESESPAQCSWLRGSARNRRDAFKVVVPSNDMVGRYRLSVAVWYVQSVAVVVCSPRRMWTECNTVE